VTDRDDLKMDLPAGKTCSDCVHFQRTCIWLIGCKPTNTRCDWNPSRYTKKVQGERA
jgi:hypothetical protein